MPAEATDVLGRLAVVESEVARLPTIEADVRATRDAVVRIEARTAALDKAEREASEGILGREFSEIVKRGALIGAILGAVWWAKPCAAELRAAAKAEIEARR